MALELEVVTPERELVHEQADEVQVPGKDGYMGILPGHAALLSELGIGSLTYTTGGRRRVLAVHGGFLEVLEDHVRVLADGAERAEEIDVERARNDQRRAEMEMNNQVEGAQTALAWAQARVAAAEHRQ